MAMRRWTLVFLSMLLTLFFPGCQREQSQPTTQPTTQPTAAAFQLADFAADQVTISAMLSSYLLITEKQDLVAELAASCRSCRFVATAQKIDVGSLYGVTFLKDRQITAKISLDQYGVCRIEGKPGQYSLSSGQLKYDRLAQIFAESRQSEMAGSP